MEKTFGASEDIRESTRYYMSMARKHIAPAIGHHSLAQVEAEDVRRFLSAMREHGHSAGYRSVAHYVLARTFKLAVREGLVLRNPLDALLNAAALSAEGSCCQTRPVPRFVWLLLGLVLLLVLVGIVGVAWFAWDQPQFYAGLLGALIGSASAVSAASLTQRYARERDAAAYRRAVVSARTERLRGHYVALVHGAQALEEASVSLQVLWAGDTEEQRNARVYEMLRRALEDLDTVVAAVRLEPGTKNVLAKWRSALGTFAYVRHIIESNTRVPNTFSMQDLIDKLGELRQEVSGLTDLASTHLEHLERDAAADA